MLFRGSGPPRPDNTTSLGAIWSAVLTLGVEKKLQRSVEACVAVFTPPWPSHSGCDIVQHDNIVDMFRISDDASRAMAISIALMLRWT